MKKRPNVLLLMADQLAAPALPVYGHRVVKAPHLSRLAERSVVFDSAYCNFPICAPKTHQYKAFNAGYKLLCLTT